eukprot:861475-Rhodomonas_salina.2
MRFRNKVLPPRIKVQATTPQPQSAPRFAVSCNPVRGTIELSPPCRNHGQGVLSTRQPQRGLQTTGTARLRGFQFDSVCTQISRPIAKRFAANEFFLLMLWFTR